MGKQGLAAQDSTIWSVMLRPNSRPMGRNSPQPEQDLENMGSCGPAAQAGRERSWMLCADSWLMSRCCAPDRGKSQRPWTNDSLLLKQARTSP